MRLTRRQQDFFKQFSALYRKLDEPLHYTTVARYMNIGKVTAYEMLRALEKKGFVRSRYMRANRGGPGRFQVVFILREGLRESTNFSWEASWEESKGQILERLKDKSEKSRTELRNQLMSKISKLNDPMLFITNIIVALLINVPYLEKEYQDKISRGITKAADIKESWLHVLPGIVLALLGAEIVDHSFVLEMVRNLAAYHEYLSLLPADQEARITEFAGEVLSLL